jgi:hypothetical protein
LLLSRDFVAVVLRTTADKYCKKLYRTAGDVAVKKRADGRGRTGDLVLTMDALYQLSYVGTARMVSLWLPWLLIARLQGGVPFAYRLGAMLAST